MGLFVLIAILILLIFAPSMLMMLAWLIVPALITIIALGYGAMWIVMTKEKQQRADADQLREKARMMPTLYGP
jgi:uncharacterized membrane-anchored protein YitT (DUF2179 family)